MINKSFIAILADLILLTAPTAAYADDGVVGRTPEGVYPMTDADVVMDSESIVVNVEKFTAQCTFVFHNTGEAKTILMGFPGRLKDEYSTELTPDVNLSIKNFKTYADGKRLSVKQENGVQGDAALPLYDQWYTFTVPFKKGGTVTVKNTYDFSPSYVSTGDVLTGYVLQTGATWKGNIGSAKVQFLLGSIKPWEVESFSPGGFRFEGNSILWERQDFEPGYDLSLVYNKWHYSSEFLDSIEPDGEEKSRILAEIEKFKEIKLITESKEYDKLVPEYTKAVEAGNRILASYIAGFLPKGWIPDRLSVLNDVHVTEYGRVRRVECNCSNSDLTGIKLRISHFEDGKAVTDAESSEPFCDFDFIPGVEYSISAKATDWMDRTETKEIKYTVPVNYDTEMSDVREKSIEEATMPIVQDKAKKEAAMATGQDKANEEAAMATEQAKANGEMTHATASPIYLWILSSLALICISTGVVVSIRRKA